MHSGAPSIRRSGARSLRLGAWSPVTVAHVIALAGFALEEATEGQDVDNRSPVVSEVGDISERQLGPGQRGICPEYVVVTGAFRSIKSLRACINSPQGRDCKEEEE